MDCFSPIPENYKKSCQEIRSYVPKQDEIEALVEYLFKAKRIKIVGSGRSEIIGTIYSLFLMANGYQNIHCSRDRTFPPYYTRDDLIIGISGSGETVTTLQKIEPAREVGANIISVTAKPGSTLAKHSKETSGFSITIPAKSKIDDKKIKKRFYERSVTGEHAPLSLEGTEFELKALSTLIDSIGYLRGKGPVEIYHNELWDLIEKYEPVPKEFEKAYEFIPEPTPKNKTVIVGEQFSGDIGKMFGIRLSHCAKRKQERRVDFFKDTGATSVNKDDCVFVVSGSGEDLPANIAKIAKEKQEANVVAVTSFPESPLGKTADAVINIPGRVNKKPKGGIYYVDPDPKACLFELRTVLTLENFIYSIVAKEKIREEDMINKHSKFT